MSLTVRPYAGQVDLQAVIDLRLACSAADTLVEWPSSADLRPLLIGYQNQIQPQEIHHIALWEDADDQLVAMAMLIGEDPQLIFFIHPQQPYRDLESQIITWGISQGQSMAQTAAKSMTLRVRPRDTDREFIISLENHGFAQGDWYTLRLVRSLHLPIPSPCLPDGFTIRSVDGLAEVEAYVALHRAAFGTENMTVDYRVALMRSPYYISALDLVVVAPDGTLAAFCVASFSEVENTVTGRRTGWTDPVGTRPIYQRKGLARAVLLAAMHGLRRHGIEIAILGTGSWNTPMRQLAESVGFRVLHNTLNYNRSAQG